MVISNIHLMPVPQTLDGFDVDDAVSRMLDQPSLWWQAIGLFVGHFADWPVAWQKSVGDDVAERRLVHALGSAAANVGASGVVAAAAELERALLQRIAGGEPPADLLRGRLEAAYDTAWGAAAAAWDADQKPAGGSA